MSDSVEIHELDDVTLDNNEYIAIMVCEGIGEFKGRPILTGHSNDATFDTPQDALDFIDSIHENPQEELGDITNHPEHAVIKPRIETES